MKLSLQDFQQKLLDSYRDTSVQKGAGSDEDDFVIRSWTPGNEGYHYSLTLKNPALDYQQLVRDEREILMSRDRKAAWWRVFDFPSESREPLEKVLPEEGFQFFEKSRLLYMPIDERVTKASSVEIRKMTPTDSIQTLKEIHDEIWGPGFDEHLQNIYDCARSPDPKTHVFFSRIKGETEWASEGWIRFYSKIGFLFGGATRAKFRGMGTYRSLVSARIEEAARAGMHYVMSQCTPDSERVLRGLGFQDAGVSTIYEFKI